MKNYTQQQLNKQRRRINQTIDAIFLPIITRSEARYDHMETFLRGARLGNITPKRAIDEVMYVATSQQFTSERFLPSI